MLYSSVSRGFQTPRHKNRFFEKQKMATTTMEKKGHVVFLPFPIQGHLNPIIQFAKRLASKGVKSTIAATTYTVAAVSSAAGISVETVSDGFDSCRALEPGFNVELYLSTFESTASEALTRLIDRLKLTESPVDCLVYDSFLPWGHEVARQNGVVSAIYFTHNITACSVLANAYKGNIEMPVDPNAAPFRIKGLPPLSVEDLPSFMTRHRLSHPSFLAILINQFQFYEKADFVFVNSVEGLEKEDSLVRENGNKENDKKELEIFPGKFVGPMVPSEYLDGRIKNDKSYGTDLWKPLSKECFEWLQTKPHKSVAYVAFGSITPISENQMAELAFGLQQTGLDLLWVLKDSERLKLPKGFSESMGEKLLVVSWCNQLEVLAHPAIGCFLTHCGWNSTLEALSLGVPLVGLPQWSDQPCVARFIEETWKIGFRVKEKDGEGIVNRDEISRCLKEAMKGEKAEEIRANAKRWKDLVRNALCEGGSSDMVIDEFVQTLRSV